MILRVVNTNTLKSFAIRNSRASQFSTVTTKKLFSTAVKNTHRPLGASKILTLATISCSATPLLFKRPVQCQATTINNKAQQVIVEIKTEQRQPILHKGELTFGTFLGLCTGYLVKKVGKLFIGFVGATFIFLQYMSFKGFITVHWDRIEGSYINTLDIDKDGKVTTRDLHRKWNSFIGFLTHNIQFKSTFLVGLYAGIRYG